MIQWEFCIKTCHVIVPAFDRLMKQQCQLESQYQEKRSLTVADTPLAPYFGAPKMTVFSYKNTSVFNLPDVAIRARRLDLIWMMCHVFETDVH